MVWNESERTALVHALTQAGPDAPTLCEGWRTRHLAAHMVLRENRPWVQGAEAVPALRRWSTEQVDGLAATALEPGGWAALLHRVEQQPSRLSPWSWAGETMNFLEYFVHTEDVRRGSDDDTPRDLPLAEETALWQQLARSARLFYRKAPTGVVLVVPDGPRRAVKAPPRPSGHKADAPGTVVISGAVSELVLHGFGRGRHAAVTLEGAPEDVAALGAVLPGGSVPHILG